MRLFVLRGTILKWTCTAPGPAVNAVPDGPHTVLVGGLPDRGPGEPSPGHGGQQQGVGAGGPQVPGDGQGQPGGAVLLSWTLASKDTY